jgi:hypothetical protein
VPLAIGLLRHQHRLFLLQRRHSLSKLRRNIHVALRLPLFAFARELQLLLALVELSLQRVHLLVDDALLALCFLLRAAVVLRESCHVRLQVVLLRLGSGKIFLHEVEYKLRRRVPPEASRRLACRMHLELLQLRAQALVLYTHMRQLRAEVGGRNGAVC